MGLFQNKKKAPLDEDAELVLAGEPRADAGRDDDQDRHDSSYAGAGLLSKCVPQPIPVR